MTPTITVVRSRAELAAARGALPEPVAAVMTMGALHAGHAALMRAARTRAAAVVVTVFVNPLQFGPGEDLDRYPRTLDADLDLCARAGVDLVFVPAVEELYPDGSPSVRVSAGALGERLEGAHRPGHFDGVLTVVTKLLHLTRPQLAFFGEKDAQQLALVRALARDLDLPVDIVGVPTVRDDDGMALSSRNAYLSAADRAAGLALSRALRAGAAAAEQGVAAVLSAATGVLAAEPAAAIDYLALVDDRTWEPADDSTTLARLLVAARVGTTRLIDNVVLLLGTTSAPSRAEG